MLTGAVALWSASLLAQSGPAADSAASETLPAKPLPGALQTLPSAFTRIGGLTLSDLRAEERHRTNLAARVSSAVVAVRIGGAMGSAVVISEDGIVLCAAHVCGQPGREVLFNFADGRTARGRTLGTNHGIDSGLMKITDPGPWPHVKVGELTQAKLGDWVLALGHPGGFDPRRPVVVRLGRIIRLTPDFLQTDCTLNSGDSGGPLFDMHGRVIGIHSRISTSLSANFHVPITTFLETWERLANAESWGSSRPVQSYVGALGLSEGGGYRLIRIEANSPAANAGLRVDDVIIEVDGKKITGGESYVRSLAAMTPGKESLFQVQRGTEKVSVRVLVGASGGFGGSFSGR